MSVTPPPVTPRVDPPAEGAVGAETAAYARARAAFNTGLVGQPVQDVRLSGRTGPAWSSADLRSPQHFTSHPRIIDAVETTSVGIETAMPHLPGRAAPAGWDGEPGGATPYGVVLP